MTIVKYFLYLLVAVFLFISAGVVILDRGFFSESLGPGKIQGKIKCQVDCDCMIFEYFGK